MLTCHSYPCSDREEVTLTLHDGMHVSVTALHEETGDTVDLRPMVNGDVLTWKAPFGNWSINEYNCIPDPESRRVNILSYDASMKFIRAMWTLFADIIEPELGSTVTMLCYRHARICCATVFCAPLTILRRKRGSPCSATYPNQSFLSARL